MVSKRTDQKATGRVNGCRLSDCPVVRLWPWPYGWLVVGVSTVEMSGAVGEDGDQPDRIK